MMTQAEPRTMDGYIRISRRMGREGPGYISPKIQREAIVADWLDERDEPGSWEAAYRPLLITNDRAMATGETRYADGKVFSNLFVLSVDEEFAGPGVHVSDGLGQADGGVAQP